MRNRPKFVFDTSDMYNFDIYYFLLLTYIFIINIQNKSKLPLKW